IQLWRAVVVSEDVLAGRIAGTVRVLPAENGERLGSHVRNGYGLRWTDFANIRIRERQRRRRKREGLFLRDAVALQRYFEGDDVVAGYEHARFHRARTPGKKIKIEHTALAGSELEMDQGRRAADRRRAE